MWKLNENANETDAKGFHENAHAANKGGRAAGDARRAAEKRTGVKVVSNQSFLKQIEAEKQDRQMPKDTEANEDESKT